MCVDRSNPRIADILKDQRSNLNLVLPFETRLNDVSDQVLHTIYVLTLELVILRSLFLKAIISTRSLFIWPAFRVPCLQLTTSQRLSLTPTPLASGLKLYLFHSESWPTGGSQVRDRWVPDPETPAYHTSYTSVATR